LIRLLQSATAVASQSKQNAACNGISADYLKQLQWNVSIGENNIYS